MACDHPSPKAKGLGVSRIDNKRYLVYKCNQCGKHLSDPIEGDITNKELYVLLSKNKIPWDRIAISMLAGIIIYEVRDDLKKYMSHIGINSVKH